MKTLPNTLDPLRRAVGALFLTLGAGGLAAAAAERNGTPCREAHGLPGVDPALCSFAHSTRSPGAAPRVFAEPPGGFAHRPDRGSADSAGPPRANADGNETSMTCRNCGLEAIRSLENPHNLTRPGPRGELGPYQFRADTWRMHTTRPFVDALHPAVSHEVAERHYDWIVRGLAQARMAANPYNIALAWNGGLRATVTGRAPRAAHRYAERAANLAGALHVERRVAAAR